MAAGQLQLFSCIYYLTEKQRSVRKLYQLLQLLQSRCTHIVTEICSDFDRASSLICGNKMPTRCNRCFFIADLIACSTCFGNHYAHHQELESIIQLVAACGLWCLVFKLSVWCGVEGCGSSLRALAHVEQEISSAIKNICCI
jgi:hypothetical protein